MRITCWVLLFCMPLAAHAAFTVNEQDGLLSLSNGESIRIAVSPEHGGELAGFAVHFKGGWQELLYRGLDYTERPGWRGKAPLLWPAVGVSMLPGEGRQQWRLNGQRLSMPFHGFARDQVWQVTERVRKAGSVSATLRISDSLDTRQHYPFGFVLQVEYLLEADRLRLVYTLSAAEDNSAPMPFSIGNHITFRTPLMPGSEPGAVRFRSDFPDLLLRDESGAFSGQLQSSPYRGWTPVAVLPRRKALSLGGTPGPARLTLLDPSGLQLDIEHRASSEPSSPAIRFNLWADMEAGFFSPEPWLGTQNSLNSGVGLVRLEPGEYWTWTINLVPGGLDQPGTAYSEEEP